MVKAGDTRECPKCHRWVHLRLLGGLDLVWAAHKQGKGKRRNCPTSGTLYKGS
jgi:hypothetical protein